MPPNSNQVPPGELPRPQYEPMPEASAPEPAPAGHETVQAQMVEQGTAPAAAAAMPTVPPPITSDDPAVATSQQSQVSPHSPQIADDADLIEKEWVNKAKHIVEQTKNDPYMQTKEMNKMKADYLKKRYAKELRLPEE